MAFSPDDKLLVASCNYEPVTMWELGTQKKLAIWDSGIDNVRSLAFGPGGEMLVTAGTQPHPTEGCSTLGEARFWKVKDGNVETGKPFASIRAEGSIDFVAISPNGKLCATGGRFCNLSVWNMLGLRASD
jgi:WD40 repeat protein